MICFIFIYLLLTKNYISFDVDSGKCPAAIVLLLMGVGELISELVWVGKLTL